MNNNKNSQVKNILGFVSVYTFIFLCLAFVLDKIFDSEGKHLYGVLMDFFSMRLP